jgi:hypothetical protein
VLVTQELLDLAEVRPGAKELRGEHVAEGVRGHAFALDHTRGTRIAKERLGEDRLRQPLAVHADEERRFAVAGTDLEVLDEERLERGMDGEGPLTAALRLPYPQQAALEVDILPVETE